MLVLHWPGMDISKKYFRRCTLWRLHLVHDYDFVSCSDHHHHQHITAFDSQLRGPIFCVLMSARGHLVVYQWHSLPHTATDWLLCSKAINGWDGIGSQNVPMLRAPTVLIMRQPPNRGMQMKRPKKIPIWIWKAAFLEFLTKVGQSGLQLNILSKTNNSMPWHAFTSSFMGFDETSFSDFKF